MSGNIDPEVQKAVNNASKPVPTGYFIYIIKSLMFHGYYLTSVCALLPIYILLAALPALGSRYKDWTFLETLNILVVRRAVRLMTVFGMQPIPPRENGWREMNNFVGKLLSNLNTQGPGGFVGPATENYASKNRPDVEWFDPPPLEAFRGVLTIRTPTNQNTNVKDSRYYSGPPLLEPCWAKARTKAFWFMSERRPAPSLGPSGSQSRPVILYFHGGAGVTMSAGDPYTGLTLARTLAKNAQMDVFSVEYGLAPFAPFPVPIMQALAAYLHLVHKHGYHPSQIFIGGDSFGGWLTLQLESILRFDCHHMTATLPNKAKTSSGVPGLLLLSPWVCCFDPKTPSRSVNGVGQRYDFITAAFADWGVRSMFGNPEGKHLPVAVDSPTASPFSTPMEDLTLPPCYIALGGVEALVDEDVMYAEKIRRAGGSVTLDIVPGLVHDYGLIFAFMSRFRETCTKMGKWCAELQS